MLLDLLGSVLVMRAVATAMIVAPEGSDLKSDHCNGQDNRDSLDIVQNGIATFNCSDSLNSRRKSLFEK